MTKQIKPKKSNCYQCDNFVNQYHTVITGDCTIPGVNGYINVKLCLKNLDITEVKNQKVCKYFKKVKVIKLKEFNYTR